ncbi:ATP-binding cassette domain-containing protein [Oleomonas cavernae]|uniref:ATP-binding cassette domain-containing protein n=1 Tax=Oleomonas cavernae TaxID=2320859 RepID=A0A418W8M0_9PROT|nr:oligopeptide/dipeptide ABC transporter ATP-binding protein [Oleomonas cavernae]RJF86338.1 ATP-binding cassette domain-containing protein [Oleomonas cavernae]
MTVAPLLEVKDLTVQHRNAGQLFNAVDGVSFTLARGETVGLVGESGCGKTTIARAVMGLYAAQGGQIAFDGADITRRSGLRARRRPLDIARRLQMVFQDPLLSLNPRATVGRILEEPLKVHGIRNRAERRAQVEELLVKVGLPASAAARLPHEFSGGQRQRIGIARALILLPELVVCDEPVSALDLSIQAQVLNLLNDLQIDLKLSYLFISHDLGVVRHMADRVIVMYLGQVVEEGPVDLLWDGARHPYTQALIASVPADPTGAGQARPKRLAAGDVPSPVDRPAGCAFNTRCPFRQARCLEAAPPLRQVASDHAVACHFAESHLPQRHQFDIAS